MADIERVCGKCTKFSTGSSWGIGKSPEGRLQAERGGSRLCSAGTKNPQAWAGEGCIAPTEFVLRLEGSSDAIKPY